MALLFRWRGRTPCCRGRRRGRGVPVCTDRGGGEPREAGRESRLECKRVARQGGPSPLLVRGQEPVEPVLERLLIIRVQPGRPGPVGRRQGANVTELAI